MAELGEQGGPTPEDTSAGTAGSPTGGPHRRWMWVSALVAIVAIGLGIWAFTLKSDRDDAQKQLDTTTQELTSTNQKLEATEQQLADQQTTQQRRSAVTLGSAAAVYTHFAKQLGATSDEL